MVYTWSFTAATPDFRCRNPSIIADVYSELSNDAFNKMYRPTKVECQRHHQFLSLNECQRCHRKSISGDNLTIDNLQPCDDYVFDTSVYRRTLVEEVRIFIIAIFQ